ncbi:MAG: ParB/RepB/Spo0J family partition protein [Clostridia bacterium]|nr:ParB/RepB/Spo0J family partition protein [Clostridia bacterium]
MVLNIDFSAPGVNGLLNSKSTPLKLKYIPFDDIVVNENNKYAISDIDSLADSIKAVGLREPIEVYPIDDDKYKIIGGERRYTAIKQLREQGDDRYDEVPCIVTSTAAIDLPLSSELKELYAITTTNAEQRDKTDADIMVQVGNLKRVYSALKEAGYSLGAKQRDLLARDLKLSKTQAQRYEYLDKNLAPELKEELMDNNLPLTVAVDAAKLPQQKQRELLEEVTSAGLPTITQQAVDEYKDTGTVSNNEGDDIDDSPVEIDRDAAVALQRKLTSTAKKISALPDTLSVADNKQLAAAIKKASAALDIIDNFISK